MDKRKLGLALVVFALLLLMVPAPAAKASPDDPAWKQTTWVSGRTTPTLQVGTWDNTYDNYYTGENENNADGELKLENKVWGGWWDNSWTRRLPITITGSHPENYQLKIIVPYDSDMKSDYGDLRFLENADNGTMNYWIENYTATQAIVWVRILENEISGDNTIYMYYGNSGATSQSNENNVFIRVIDGAQPVKGSWSLDEGGGTTAYDNSGIGNNGTLQGNAAWTSAGKFGKAVAFDGSNDWIQVPDSDSLDDTQYFTFEAWFYDTANDANPRGIGSKRVSSTSELAWCVFLYTTRYIYLYINSGSNSYNSGTALVANQWNHIVVTFDGTASSAERVKFYINGTLVATRTTSQTSILNRTSNLCIGILNANYGYSWQGTIDEVRVYKKTLTSTEILDIYNNYGYVTPNYPGRVLVRKYGFPEPTPSVGAEQTPHYYPSAGYIESSIYDATSAADWKTVSWENTTPSGTSIIVKVRSGSDDNPYPNDTENWSVWCVHENNTENISLTNNRYVQYRVELSTTDHTKTPELFDIMINYEPGVPSFTFNLRAGWNLIGSPLGGASIEYPDDNPDNSVLPIAYTWNGSSYVSTTNLVAGAGYWVNALDNCELRLPGGG